jgi:hypothetical protein
VQNENDVERTRQFRHELMADPTIGYGSVDKPWFEAFGVITEVRWGGGTVVIVELPDEFAYILSNDPTSPDFPDIQAFYATDTTIPKVDYNDTWQLEPINDPDGRYYTSRSFLAAPAGYEGYAPLLVITAGSGFPDPIADGAYSPYGLNSLAAEFFGINSATDAEAYYDDIDPELQPLYTIVHREESGPDARVYNNGEWLRGTSIPNVLGSGTDPDDPTGSANCVFQIGIPDISTPYCALVNMKRTNEVELWQKTVNFQDGHSPVPAVKLRAYGDSSTPQPAGDPIARQYFKVDAATKRLNKYTVTIDPDTGLPVETETTPKWTRTVNLAAYPPARDENTSLGKFNAKGFALPGDPLP